MGIFSKLKHKIAVTKSNRREKRKEKLRSPKWSSTRDSFLKSHNTCSVCMGTSNLQVHHIKPFHKYPELELDSENLITLCMGDKDCHLGIGHGGSFDFYNPKVREDVKLLTEKLSLFDKLKTEIKQRRFSNTNKSL